MKKRFTLSLIALIASAFLFVITSFAWFMVSNRNAIDNLPGNLSGILYDFNGEFVTGSVIYPELELISEQVSITNYTQDDYYLRMKIEYTKIDVTYDNINYTYSISEPTMKNYTNVSSNEHIKIEMNENFFYEADGYWYYDEILVQNINHILLTSLLYDGFKVSNEYATKDLVISIDLEITYDQEGIWSPLTTMIYTGTM